MDADTVVMEKKSKSDSNSRLELQVKNAGARFGEGAYEVKVVGASDSGKSTVVLTSPRSLAFKR